MGLTGGYKGPVESAKRGLFLKLGGEVVSQGNGHGNLNKKTAFPGAVFLCFSPNLPVKSNLFPNLVFVSG
jgi:hypothetical protein